MISQKATILCVYEILRKYSDENHILTAENIKSKLKLIYDVDMERRAIYRNISYLKEFGIDIECYEDNREGYWLVDRELEPSEVRALCDAIAGSTIIGSENAEIIMKKLFDTQSVYESQTLRRTLFVKKSGIEQDYKVFYHIDKLNVAISQGYMISLQINDLVRETKGKDRILFSPFATCSVDGHYYLIGKEFLADTVSHIRIDFIKSMELTEQPSEMLYGGIDVAAYIEKNIMSDGGKNVTAQLECKEKIAIEVFDSFSSVTKISEKDGNIVYKVVGAETRIKAFALANLDSCVILSPISMRSDISSTIAKAYKKYIG